MHIHIYIYRDRNMDVGFLRRSRGHIKMYGAQGLFRGLGFRD